METRTSKRFAGGNKNPGPGSYFKNYTEVEDSVFSKNKSIGREMRRSFVEVTAKESITPGPGSYKLKTDFGHYRKIVGV